MSKKVFNIEPFIHNIEELSFSRFYQMKLDSPYIHQSLFEEKLQSFLRTEKEICSLSSGTAAIHLALKLSEIKSNDVVFCSNASFIASVNPILYENAEPYFIDVSLETGNINTEYLEKAILECLKNNKNPKAIIVTHSYGVPSDLDELQIIKNKYNLILIEDAAEALGSTYDSQSCGTIGDYGILSFNTNKLSTTLGGGALIVGTKQEKQKVKSLASQSKMKSQEFIHNEIGYNYLMNDLAAYLGVYQLTFIKEELGKKEKIFRWYKEALSDIEEIELLFATEKRLLKSNRWMNCVSFLERNKKEKALSVFQKENIEVRGYWYPMTQQQFLKEFPYMGEGETAEMYERTLCLPSGINLKKEDVFRISEVLKSILDK